MTLPTVYTGVQKPAFIFCSAFWNVYRARNRWKELVACSGSITQADPGPGCSQDSEEVDRSTGAEAHARQIELGRAPSLARRCSNERSLKSPLRSDAF